MKFEVNTTSIGTPQEKEGRHTIFESKNYEYVNPIDLFMNQHIGVNMGLEENMLKLQGKNFSNEIASDAFRRGILDWQKHYDFLKKIEMPETLLSLLKSEKKKEQERLLKGLKLDTNTFQAFIIKAFEDFGYRYSIYKAAHYHKGLITNHLPALAHIDKSGIVHTIGETILTKGQLTQAIQHRKVIVSKFLDKGNRWHCFFLTIKSIRGEENYKNGQPHLHYISNFWNKSRKEVIKQLTSKKYKLPALPHIDYSRA